MQTNDRELASISRSGHGATSQEPDGQLDPSRPMAYQIRITGLLDARWADWFEGLTITLDGGDTLITGPVVDQAALHGLLKKVRDLGMPLVSVSPVEADLRPPSGPARQVGRVPRCTARRMRFGYGPILLGLANASTSDVRNASASGAVIPGLVWHPVCRGKSSRPDQTGPSFTRTTPAPKAASQRRALAERPT